MPPFFLIRNFLPSFRLIRYNGTVALTVRFAEFLRNRLAVAERVVEIRGLDVQHEAAASNRDAALELVEGQEDARCVELLQRPLDPLLFDPRRDIAELPTRMLRRKYSLGFIERCDL